MRVCCLRDRIRSSLELFYFDDAVYHEKGERANTTETPPKTTEKEEVEKRTHNKTRRNEISSMQLRINRWALMIM